MADSKLIAVMGPTGSGKTTFINLVSGSKLRVGYGLESCTSEIELAQFELGGQLITLIDTPGFDDTQRTQADILKEEAAGVIYFHRISDFRMSGIARENFRLFRKICGDDAMKNVVIVTNMWDGVTADVGNSRENELATKPLFFKDAVDNGARLVRNYNTIESAHTILRSLMGNLPKVLQMQRELVDEHKTLPQTSAGVELQVELEMAEKRHQAELQELREEFREISARKDAAYAQELGDIKATCARLQDKLTNIEREKVEITEKDREEHQAKMTYLLDAIARREAEMEAAKRDYEAKLSGMKERIEAVEQDARAKEEQAQLQVRQLAEAHARREAEAQKEAEERRRAEEQRSEEIQRQEEARREEARQEAERREQARREAEALQEQLRQEAAQREIEILTLKQQHDNRFQEMKEKIKTMEQEAVEWQEKARKEQEETQARREAEARLEVEARLQAEARREEAARQEAARREAERQNEVRREEARWAEERREEARKEEARQEEIRREAARREEASQTVKQEHEKRLEELRNKIEALEKETRAKEAKAQQEMVALREAKERERKEAEAKTEVEEKVAAERRRKTEERRAEEARKALEDRKAEDARREVQSRPRPDVEAQARRTPVDPPSIFALVRNVVRVFLFSQSVV
ncbi:hypothetical protein B0H21DRAFT_823964 [Amylocystis lapponica]|nr:hypothetical protein B0H21DRAFT_823964 [Amylocystis lapponica]